MELKRGDCWCECGIDNPDMRGKHSDTCNAIKNLLGTQKEISNDN